MKTFIGNAVAMTRLLAEDPFRTLPDPKYYQGRAAVELGLNDPEYQALTPKRRHDYVKGIEDACLAGGGDKVISVTAGSSDGHYEEALVTSNGFDGYAEATVFVGSAEMTAKDEGDRRPAEFAYAVTPARAPCPSPKTLGGSGRANPRPPGRKKIKTETLPIIIENRVVPGSAGVFFRPCSAGASSRSSPFSPIRKARNGGFTPHRDRRPVHPGEPGQPSF